jgi:hypothetical protein
MKLTCETPGTFDKTEARMSQSLQQDVDVNKPGISPSTEAHSGPVDWKKLCQELKAEQELLRAEIAEVKDERDACLKALKVTLPEKDYSFTKEELLAQVGQLPPLKDVIAKLKRELGN